MNETNKETKPTSKMTRKELLKEVNSQREIRSVLVDCMSEKQGLNRNISLLEERIEELEEKLKRANETTDRIVETAQRHTKEHCEKIAMFERFFALEEARAGSLRCQFEHGTAAISGGYAQE